MPLIKDGHVAENPWASVDDDDALPADGPVIVSLARWTAERETLRGRDAPVGVRLSSNETPGLIADDIGHLGLIALEFPAFTDGRAYSHARLLRERHGFKGELRATGNVLRDQAQFMIRCGFDTFEVAKGKETADWLRALSEIDVLYQPAADGVTSVPWRRHAGA